MASIGTELYFPTIAERSYNYDKTTNLTRNMEENEVLSQLKDQRFDKRAEILDQLRSSSRRNGGKLPFQNPKLIFKGLALVLEDTNWDVRHQCIKLIHELLPNFGPDLDNCMALVLPKIVPNIGDSKITLRGDVIQMLHSYMMHTKNMQQLLRAIVQHGLENSDPKIKKQFIVSLPILFTPEFSEENFFEIAQALAKRLLDSTEDDENLDMKPQVLLVLDKLRELVGKVTFNSYVQKLAPGLRKYYYKLTNDNSEYHNGENGTKVTMMMSKDPNGVYDLYSLPGNVQKSSFVSQRESLEFDIIPSHIMKKLNDQDDFMSRAHAVEELKILIQDQISLDSISPKNILNFISFLNNLLDDTNFKIRTVTLEILGLIIEKFGFKVKPHLKPIVLTLSKRIGDNNITIRQIVMKNIMQLMQMLEPEPVLSVMSENFSNKNPRVRHETINLVIASLLTFPSYDFNLGNLCQTLAVTLLDPKKQVRQAAMECFAVIASAMGAGRLQPLVSAVDRVELSYEGDGVMAAVQARLLRRQLPRLNRDGLVEYATLIPSSARHRLVSAGADIDWILSAGRGVGSPPSARTDVLELESVTSTPRSTPPNFMSVQDSPARATPSKPRSAGKSKSKFPWEIQDQPSHENNDSNLAQGSAKAETTRPIIKGRGTWPGEDLITDDGSNKTPTPNSRRKTVGPRDQPSEKGSYWQRYLEKYKKQNTDEGLVPSSFHPQDQDDDMDSYLAAHINRREDPSRFSQSWPDSDMYADARKDTKRLLDPIPVTDTAQLPYKPDWPDAPEDTKRKYENGNAGTPIPTKPRLAPRLSAHTRKVPPISQPEKPASNWDPKHSNIDAAFEKPLSSRELRSDMPDFTSEKLATHNNHQSNILDLSTDIPPPLDDDKEEMQNSLRLLRNSANRKLERQQSKTKSQAAVSSPPLTPEDSGLFSYVTNNRSDLDELDATPTPKKRGKKSGMSGFAFENKPVIARQGSHPPRDNSSLVEVVGRGIADDTQLTDPKPLFTAVKLKDRKKFQKAMRSPMGIASIHSPGQIDLDDDKVPDGVVGRSMLDTNSTGSDNSVTSTLSERNGRRPSRTEADPSHYPRVVYGTRVRQSSPEKQAFHQVHQDEPDDDDVSSLSMSTAMRERLAQKQKEKQTEEEQRKWERERDKQELEEKKKKRQEEFQKKERERQQERLRMLTEGVVEPDNEELSISGSGQPSSPALHNNKSPVDKQKNLKLKKKSVPSEKPSLSSRSNTSDSDDLTKPFRDPSSALQEALKLIANEDWQAKCSGLSMVRRLSMHHFNMLISHLHVLIIAVLQEAKNARSQVCKQALVTLADMYANLKRNMDLDLEQTVKVLLQKSADSNEFIRDDAEKALLKMVQNVTPQRAMLALIAGGASHKSPAVRMSCSHSLVYVVESMGPGRVLSGIKDVTERILPVAADFLLDGSPETRYNGQKIFYMLMSHEDLEKLLKKHLTASTLRNIQNKLDNLRKKGLGDPPSLPPSARSRRAYQGPSSGTSTRGDSASSGFSEIVSDAPTLSSKRRATATRTDEATMEDIRQFCALMSANVFSDRHKGLNDFQTMAETNPAVVGTHIIKIFDKFVPCMKDPNSKVNLRALQVMEQVTPVLSEHMAQVINMTVRAVTGNLSSKNKDIHDTAAAVLDLFMERLDNAMLLQPFSDQAQSGNIRMKPDMIDRTAYLVTQLYDRKSKQVVLHVLPLLWHLLGSSVSSGATPGSSGSLRRSTTSLANSLYSVMGQNLLDHANSNSNVTPRMQQQLQDMLEQL